MAPAGRSGETLVLVLLLRLGRNTPPRKDPLHWRCRHPPQNSAVAQAGTARCSAEVVRLRSAPPGTAYRAALLCLQGKHGLVGMDWQQMWLSQMDKSTRADK